MVKHTDAQFLASELEKLYHPKEIIINEMGSVVATFAGKIWTNYYTLTDFK